VVRTGSRVFARDDNEVFPHVCPIFGGQMHIIAIIAYSADI
jgi:hypothetical protein